MMKTNNMAQSKQRLVVVYMDLLSFPRVQDELTPEEAAMAREVTRGHEMACKRAACTQTRGTGEGALMHVTAEHAEVLLVVNPSDGTSF